MNGVLNGLYAEFFKVSNMTNEEVCRRFNVDTKEEYVEILQWEIELEESKVIEGIPLPYVDADVERERAALCESQGLSRYC